MHSAEKQASIRSSEENERESKWHFACFALIYLIGVLHDSEFCACLGMKDKIVWENTKPIVKEAKLLTVNQMFPLIHLTALEPCKSAKVSD